MKYPALCPWVELSSDDAGLHLTDTKQNKRFRVPRQYEPLIRGLDGRTSPRQLAPDLSEAGRAALLKDLKDRGLTRQRPAFSGGPLSLYFTVPLPAAAARTRRAARMFNQALMKLWLPLLLPAVWASASGPAVLPEEHIWLGSITGAVLGLLLHELAHACACLTYGGKISSCGLMLWCLLPCAFVELDTAPIRRSLQRTQVFAAGVEMNLLLTGFFLLLARCTPALGSPCICAAVSNALLGLVNLTLSFGLDGSHIFSALLGVDDFAALSLEILADRSSRRHLRRRGLSGRAALCACAMGVLMLLSLPLLMFVNLSEVLLWLF